MARNGAGVNRGGRTAASARLAADAALRAAALLRGGVPAGRVWRVLGEQPDATPEFAQIATRIAQGESAASALANTGEQAWKVLAAAWQIAERSGAPLAAVLERLAQALAELERLGERRSVLLAGPRATIRLVASLPPLALLLSWALGFDPGRVLFSPLGLALGSLGGALLLIGIWWARRLIEGLASADWIAGLECELAWVALSGGGAPGGALRRVADCADAIGARWVRLSALRRDGPVRGVLAAAASLGTPVGSMLLAEAQAARARALAELEREAERLGVRVLLPIGLCVLPSFIVLGVLPVLFAVMGGLVF